MKNNFILIASLALFTTVASAASANNSDTGVPTLPAYVVTVDRETEVERAINASLDELRSSANVAPVVTARPALPATNLASGNNGKPAPVADSNRGSQRDAARS